MYHGRTEQAKFAINGGKQGTAFSNKCSQRRNLKAERTSPSVRQDHPNISEKLPKQRSHQKIEKISNSFSVDLVFIV